MVGRKEVERLIIDSGTAEAGSWTYVGVMRCGAISPVIEGAPSTQLGGHHNFLMGAIHSHGCPGVRRKDA